MAITASGLFCPTIRDALLNVIALDVGLETHKGALFSDTVAPDFTADTAYAVAPYNANEVTGTNWPAGGVALTGTTLTASAGSIVYDATDVSVAAASFTGAMGYLLYADALAPKAAICLIDFVTAQSPSNGTFTIQWDPTGIFAIDLTPV